MEEIEVAKAFLFLRILTVKESNENEARNNTDIMSVHNNILIRPTRIRLSLECTIQV